MPVEGNRLGAPVTFDELDAEPVWIVVSFELLGMPLHHPLDWPQGLARVHDLISRLESVILVVFRVDRLYLAESSSAEPGKRLRYRQETGKPNLPE